LHHNVEDFVVFLRARLYSSSRGESCEDWLLAVSLPNCLANPKNISDLGVGVTAASYPVDFADAEKITHIGTRSDNEKVNYYPK
jgi:hypothetical protein